MTLNTSPISPEAQRPVLNLVGDSVALGPLRSDLVADLYRWDNDFATGRKRGTAPKPRTLEEIAELYFPTTPSPREAWFTIYERGLWRPVGLTWLSEISISDRTATYGVFIGELDARGRGLGTEATRLMLEYAFNELGLHSVMLIVAAFNHAASRAYSKAGFREFGRRRESYRLSDGVHDDVYMECLATEYTPMSKVDDAG